MEERWKMQKVIVKSSFPKLTINNRTLRIIISTILTALLLFGMLTPLHALTPARDLTGTWRCGVSEVYYDMDPSDGTMRMNDITSTYEMDITQTGSQIQIVFYTFPTSYKTDAAYWSEYEMQGVPPVSGGDILFKGTVSGASFSADEYPTSSLTQEHLAGTFTTDIITATLTGLLYTTDTNGIIVIRSGSSATMPPIATIAPTATPAPTPTVPTSTNLASVSQLQGSTSFTDSDSPITIQSPIGTGAKIQTGPDGIIGFNYPDLGGTVYLGANSNAAWVYPNKQIDPINGNISYTIVPSLTTGTIPFEEGLEADEFGQVGITLPLEIAVGMLVLGETLPAALAGAAVVEGTMLLGTGIAYVHEQLSPQEGTLDVKPIQLPQGMVMGSGTDYVVSVADASTTIQVIDGSVIFVDQYTLNNITVNANQELTLPRGLTAGFSAEDLQAKVSSFDASTISQWWVISAPTATPIVPTDTPVTPAQTALPTKTSASGLNFLTNPMILAFAIIIIIIVVVAIVALLKRKTRTNKKKTEDSSTVSALAQTSAVFCPNCGNQLLSTQGACPFCNFDLKQLKSNKE
jgi:hypothetical protein